VSSLIEHEVAGIADYIRFLTAGTKCSHDTCIGQDRQFDFNGWLLGNLANGLASFILDGAFLEVELE